MIETVIIPSTDPLAQDAISFIAQQAQLSWVILFGGDRWSCIEWVAVAREGDAIVGLASLSPTDEMGNIGPHIIGVWVEKSHRRQKIGTQLVQALARKSLNEYGTEPTIVAVTLDGQQLVDSFTYAVPVNIIRVGAFSNLD